MKFQVQQPAPATPQASPGGNGQRVRIAVSQPQQQAPAQQRVGAAIPTQPQGRLVTQVPTPPEEEEFIYPTPEEVLKRIEDEEAGDHIKFTAGMNPLLILPARGLKYPWLEMRVHWCSGRDVLDLLGLDAKSRPEELPMAHACARFHGNTHCEWCAIIDKLKKSRNKTDRELGGALFASLSCECDAIDLRKNPLMVQPLTFRKTIRDALLGVIGNGTIFFHHQELREVHVKKILKGSQVWECDYNVICPPRSRGPAKPEWLAARRNLAAELPPIPTPDEVKETFELLRSTMNIPVNAAPDVGSDIEQNYGYQAGGSYNDDIAF